jgi:glycosyltransferase involved in cell wall biosynthesis
MNQSMSGFRAIHIIAAVQTGGAETALERTIRSTQALGWSHTVVNLCSDNHMAARIAAAGAELVHLDWARGSIPGPREFSRLRVTLRAHRADITMGWMYHGNAALTMGRLGLARMPGMIWAIRSGVSPHQRRSTALVRRALGLIAHVPDRVVFVSERSRRQHAPLGFHRSRSVCIPNGYDLDRFRPDAQARALVRAELGLDAHAPVVAWIGRWHPDKAPQQAIAAFQRAAAVLPDLHLVMAGSGCEVDGPAGAALAGCAASRVRLLGRRDDIPAILAAADVLLLS